MLSRQSHLLLAVLLGFVLSLVAGVASGQQGTSTIRGRALDGQGGLLPGVAVIVTHQDTGVFRDTVTGADGTYSVTNLVAGPYRVSAELQGFRQLTREGIVLGGATTQTVDLQLEVGALAETVTVSGAAPQVDLTTAQVGGRVSRAEIEVIPSISHTVIGFLQVVPGVVFTPGATKPSLDSISVNGSSLGVLHYLDGGANFSGVFPASWTRVLVPSEAVQEVVAVTSQAPAEYGERTGAVINSISKQGTNALRGSAYGSYISDGLTAANYFQERDSLDKPEASRHVAGFTLGGPIVRDKLFFFGLLEHTYQARAVAVTYPSNPDKSFATQSVVKGFNGFARVDYQVNPTNAIAARYLQREARCIGDTGCRAGGVGTSIPTNGATLQSLNDEWEIDTLVVANYNRVVSNTKLNVFTFSFPRQTILANLPDSEPSELTDCVPCLPPTLRQLSFDDQVTYFHHQRWEPVYRFENAFSWFLPGRGIGSHDLKLGGLYGYAIHRQLNPDAENGIFGFPSNTPFNPANPSTYPERLTIRNGPQESSPDQHSFALYAQDKWQLGNLTLNLGVRYELVKAVTPNEYNPLFDDPASYPIDLNNVQPRLGFAYAGGDQKGVIRGGYGQFFQSPTFSDLIDNFWRQGVYGTGLVVNFPASGVPDPGPAAGRFPTDPFLVNGPVVNRELLEQTFPAGSLIRSNSAVYLDHPDRQLPTTRQATLGYEREMGQFSLAADYVRIWGTNLVPYDLNPGVRSSTSRTAPITRTDLLGLANSLAISPFSTSVFTYLSDGREHYDGLNLSLDRRFLQWWSARVAYTLARGRSDSAQSNLQFLDQRYPELAWGPTARTHVVSLSGRVEVPRTGGLGISGTFRAMTGSPITITNSNVDADRNGILFDPLPAGTYSGTGADAMTVENMGGVGGAIGPGFAQLDLRMSYRFRLGNGRTLDTGVDVFNLTNEPNFANPSGDQRQPSFLVPTSLASGGIPRQLQITARFGL